MPASIAPPDDRLVEEIRAALDDESPVETSGPAISGCGGPDGAAGYAAAETGMAVAG
jgi:hypothetical protein